MQKIQTRSIINSLIWKILERAGVQGIQFILAIILARLLSPKEYGTVSLITIFIALAAVFVQSGLSTSLIQKSNADELDFSSVFYLSLLIATMLYLVLFFCAPVISSFYNTPVLISIIRLLSLTLFLGAINGVQMAMISRRMEFKKYFFSSLGGVIGSGVVGLLLAYRGFGVWALVAQQLTSNILITVILWFTVKWRPIFAFSFTRVKKLFSFGWKLLVSGLIHTFFINIYGLVIGKFYSTSSLGYFNRGQQFPSIIATNIDGSIQSVMLPALASRQSDIISVKSLMRRSMKTSTYILMPLMIGLAAIAKTLVLLILGKKWLPCVPFLQLACISYALYPIHTANLTAINAIGRSDIFLKLEIVKKVIVLIILFFTLRRSIYEIAIGQAFCDIISTFINAYPNKELLGYSYKEQVSDILPPIILALFMGVCVYLLGLLQIDNIIKLIIQIVIGMIIYLKFSIIFQFDSFSYIMDTVKSFKKERLVL